MKNNIQLKIDTSCSENWNKMDDCASGKFCQSCSKTVVDLTQLKDGQIRKLIVENKQGFCGRAKSDQLNRNLLKETNPSFMQRLIPPFLAGVLSLSLPQIANAQTKEAAEYNNEVNHPVYIPQPIDTVNKALKVSVKLDTTSTLKRGKPKTIYGKVVDSLTGGILPFALVVITGTQTGTITDTNGEFQLKLPDSLMEDTINISVQYIGFETIQKSIFIGVTDPTNIIRIDPLLLNQTLFIVGGITSYSYPRRKVWNTWRWFYRIRARVFKY